HRLSQEQGALPAEPVDAARQPPARPAVHRPPPARRRVRPQLAPAGPGPAPQQMGHAAPCPDGDDDVLLAEARARRLAARPGAVADRLLDHETRAFVDVSDEALVMGDPALGPFGVLDAR